MRFGRRPSAGHLGRHKPSPLQPRPTPGTDIRVATASLSWNLSCGRRVRSNANQADASLAGLGLWRVGSSNWRQRWPTGLPCRSRFSALGSLWIRARFAPCAAAASSSGCTGKCGTAASMGVPYSLTCVQNARHGLVHRSDCLALSHRRETWWRRHGHRLQGRGHRARPPWCPVPVRIEERCRASRCRRSDRHTVLAVRYYLGPMLAAIC
jgi:hypothetical protein